MVRIYFAFSSNTDLVDVPIGLHSNGYVRLGPSGRVRRETLGEEDWREVGGE